MPDFKERLEKGKERCRCDITLIGKDRDIKLPYCVSHQRSDPEIDCDFARACLAVLESEPPDIYPADSPLLAAQKQGNIDNLDWTKRSILGALEGEG